MARMDHDLHRMRCLLRRAFPVHVNDARFAELMSCLDQVQSLGVMSAKADHGSGDQTTSAILARRRLRDTIRQCSRRKGAS